ncbi:Cell division control protein 48-C-like protein [Morus notabilis]|uniref:Cell division control protein 48-C-like protein n=1 Tax=Morus notabilis TaxID=981085 RepID=W9SAC4_9ROSA|nr:Cell division control protein 48-C-like protein [Morus notabilis]
MRRLGRGGFGGGGSMQNRVRLCLKSFKNLHSFTVEEIVDHLKTNNNEIGRQKKPVLARLVRQALDSSSASPKPNPKKQSRSPPPLLFDDGEDDDGALIGARKKPKRSADDDGEERLRLMEKARLQRIQRSDQERPSTSEKSTSDEDEEEEEDSVDGDGAVSTSEDAIYGEKLEPKFDLMKSMLRDSYREAHSAAAKLEEKDKEKNLELELPSREKVRLVSGIDGGRAGKKLAVESKRESKGSSSVADVEVKGNSEGPRFRDLGGMRKVLEELETEVLLPLYHPQILRQLGVRPITGILLHGPPGCGKTKLAHAIANETGVPFYRISATEVVSGVSGASEENIRELFLKAQRTAPSIVFIDEIDAIASKRENLQREMERRIVTQLMVCMDESHRLVKPTDVNSESKSPDSTTGYVLVIGATNRPDAVDPALRRPGRFDREITLGVPDETARAEILSVRITNNGMRLEGSFDLLKIARSTPGFVGADLVALANKAGNIAMKRISDDKRSKVSKDCKDEEHYKEWWKEPWSPEEMEKLTITMADFEEAVKLIQPSSKREGFSDIPNIKWEDVGGLDLLRRVFDRYIVRCIKYPEEYEEFGVNLETGFLLYGPPGCGKTLIAKAVAHEAGANFIHIKGPELLNKYVGESELAVRTLFSRAKTCSPCILFFDEVDALTTNRGKEGGWVTERLLNQNNAGVYIPEVMDNALLRPGRFGKLLYVPLPSPEERGLILKTLARKKPVDASVDLNLIAQMEACENFSGADLSALVNEAAMAALEEKLTSTNSNVDGVPRIIKATHFELAATKITPSVTIEVLVHSILVDR